MMVFMSKATLLANAGFDGVAAAISKSWANAPKSPASVVFPTWFAVADAL